MFPRDKVRSKLLELLGLDEIPKEIDFAEGTTREEEGIRVTQLTYVNSLGETVPGIIMTPLNASSQKAARRRLRTRNRWLRPKDCPSTILSGGKSTRHVDRLGARIGTPRLCDVGDFAQGERHPTP